MQDIDIPENKVIIIGGDHHNGLGLARQFGLNGKKIDAVVVSKKKHSWMTTSKFFECSHIAKTEKDAFDYILQTYSNESCKPFLIPYSDGAALELDSRLNEFKDKFFVPSINEKQGAIVSLMDKKAQYEWALIHNIKMARSEVLDLNNVCLNVEKYDCPIILKPVVSAQGSKKDIRICNNSDSFKTAVHYLKSKNYSTTFLQDYLNVDYEITIMGAINPDKSFYYSANKVIRSWPPKGGTSSFTSLITDKKILEECSELMKLIAEYGYRGSIDIDTFWVDGKQYLNEINWRNSGNNFRARSCGFFFVFWHYLFVTTGLKIGDDWKPFENSYSMVEYTDIRHVLKNGLPLKKWWRDFCKVENFSLYQKGDLKPLLFKFLNVVRR